MRRILLVIGLILSIILILGFLAPKQYELIHKTEIKAPRIDVYPFLNTLQMTHQWSGIVPQTDDFSFTYGGTPGTVGSEVHWKHKSRSNEGRETITKVIPLARIESTIRYIRPWESLNHSVFYLEGEDDTTTVQWHFHGHSPFPFNIRHLFMDMATELGPTHQEALGRLKRLAEIEHIEQKLHVEKDTLQTARLVTIDTISTLSNQSISELDEATIKAIYPRFEPQQCTLIVTGIQNTKRIQIPLHAADNELKRRPDTIPASTGYVAWHEGGYSALADASEQLEHYLELKNNTTATYDISYELLRHAHNEEDSTKWLTAIRATEK